RASRVPPRLPTQRATAPPQRPDTWQPPTPRTSSHRHESGAFEPPAASIEWLAQLLEHDWEFTRTISGRLEAWRRRDGRGVSRIRYEAQSRRRSQAPARRVHKDPDRLSRFKREAQVLASLNHPNITAIYGFEDTGGAHALVIELVEGATLAARIEHGPIPLDEALPIARQIADALEAAHDHGVIHRDLKPANIKVRPDGAVKVL